MKTNGYDLSRRLFDFAFEHAEAKCQHTALFMWIIELNNRLGWKEQFGLPTHATMEGLHIGNKSTYINALRDLAKWNFIQIVKESKNQYASTVVSLCRSKKATFTPPSENDIYNFMGELNMKSGGKWTEAKIVTESKNCFDYYTITGWKTSGGAKIVSWQATVRKWMNNQFKFEANKKSNSYGKHSNSTQDSIAKAEQLFRDAVAISNARDQARQDSTTA